jgi:hypothetical protein
VTREGKHVRKRRGSGGPAIEIEDQLMKDPEFLQWRGLSIQKIERTSQAFPIS